MNVGDQLPIQPQQGWQCPLCKKILAPWMPSCNCQMAKPGKNPYPIIPSYPPYPSVPFLTPSWIEPIVTCDNDIQSNITNSWPNGTYAGGVAPACCV